ETAERANHSGHRTRLRWRDAPRLGDCLGFQTDCTTTGEDREAYLGSVPPPIYESSLFTFPTFAEFESAIQGTAGRPVYTRGSNPTVRALEDKLALLERGEDARVFASGMAAIAAGVMSFAG